MIVVTVLDIIKIIFFRREILGEEADEPSIEFSTYDRCCAHCARSKSICN